MQIHEALGDHADVAWSGLHLYPTRQIGSEREHAESQNRHNGRN